jgi:hypothetical protein
MHSHVRVIQLPVAALEPLGPILEDDGSDLIARIWELQRAGVQYLLIDLKNIWLVGVGGLFNLVELHRAWIAAGGVGVRVVVPRGRWISLVARRWIEDEFGETFPTCEAAVVGMWMDERSTSLASHSQAA